MASYVTSIVLQWSSDNLTGETRITNPTFDTDITGWTETDSGGASLTPTHDTTVMRSGAGSLKLVQTAAGDDDHMSCTFSGTAGVTYQIKAWINVTAFTFGSTGLRAFGPGGTPNSFTVISAVTDGWVQQAVELTPTTSGNVTVRLYSPQGTCYWDDVSVVAWTTVDNNEIQSLEWWAGIDREGNDPEPGGMTVTLKNKLRKWEPLFGSNTIDTQQRFRLTLNGTQEGVWYTETFELDYPTGQEFSWVTITCGDGISVLALDDLPSLDPPDADSYADVVNFDQPLAHYPLDDPAGTTAVPNMRIIRKRGGKKRRKVQRGQRMLPTEAVGAAGNTGLYVDPGRLIKFRQPSCILGDAGFAVQPEDQFGKAPVERTAFYEPNAFSVEAWLRKVVAGLGPVASGPFRTATGDNIFGLDAASLTVYTSTGGAGLALVSSPSVGDVFHLVGTWDGTTARLYFNGVEEDSASPGGTLLQGDANEFIYFIGNQAGSHAQEQDETVFYEHALTPERVMAHYQAGALRGYQQQTAGERIAAIADSALWSGASIQTAGRDVLPIMHHGQGRMEEIAEAAHAEGPRTLFFFNGNGDPVYLGHEWTATNANYNTVQYTFTDDGTGLPYNDTRPEYDFETFNKVVASHESGESVIVEDATEQGKRGVRVNPEYTDVLLVEHNHVESLATHVLDLYREPVKRFPSITIDGYHCLAQILDLDIGHLIRVKKSGETGSPTDRVCHILSKRKRLVQVAAGGLLYATYGLSRGFDGSDGYWHLGYAGFSELGSTTIAAP